MLNRIWTLIVKEFYSTLQDKRGRFALIVPPIIQLLIFSVAATLDVKDARIGILNEDYGKSSFELIQRFQGSRFFNHITYLTNKNQIEEYIDNQKVTMVVHFNSQFSKEVLKGGPARVQLLLDGRKSNSSQIILGYTTTIIDQYNAELNEEMNLGRPKIVVIDRNWFNPNLIYTWFTVPGLVAVLSMQITLIITALSVAREKEMGTFEQLLVTPLSTFEILAGKTMPALFIASVEGTLMLLAGIFVFQIPFTGSFLFLYLSLIIFIFSIVGVGLFISSLAKTQQQAALGVFMFMAPAIGLSGFATPIESMPEWLQTAMLANPLRFFLVIVRGSFLKDLPADVILANIYPMLIIAAFTLTTSAWLFRKRLE